MQECQTLCAPIPSVHEAEHLVMKSAAGQGHLACGCQGGSTGHPDDHMLLPRKAQDVLLHERSEAVNREPGFFTGMSIHLQRVPCLSTPSKLFNEASHAATSIHQAAQSCKSGRTSSMKSV